VNNLAKYKCVSKFTYMICNKKGLLQIISKSYARVRHYSHLDPATRRPQFIYHKQSLEYVQNMKSTDPKAMASSSTVKDQLTKPRPSFHDHKTFKTNVDLK